MAVSAVAPWSEGTQTAPSKGGKQRLEQRTGLVGDLDAVVEELPRDAGVVEPTADQPGIATAHGIQVLACCIPPLGCHTGRGVGPARSRFHLNVFGFDEEGRPSGPAERRRADYSELTFGKLEINPELLGPSADRLAQTARLREPLSRNCDVTSDDGRIQSVEPLPHHLQCLLRALHLHDGGVSVGAQRVEVLERLAGGLRNVVVTCGTCLIQ